MLSITSDESDADPWSELFSTEAKILKIESLIFKLPEITFQNNPCITILQRYELLKSLQTIDISFSLNKISQFKQIQNFLMSFQEIPSVKTVNLTIKMQILQQDVGSQGQDQNFQKINGCASIESISIVFDKIQQKDCEIQFLQLLNMIVCNFTALKSLNFVAKDSVIQYPTLNQHFLNDQLQFCQNFMKLERLQVVVLHLSQATFFDKDLREGRLQKVMEFIFRLLRYSDGFLHKIINKNLLKADFRFARLWSGCKFQENANWKEVYEGIISETCLNKLTIHPIAIALNNQKAIKKLTLIYQLYRFQLMKLMRNEIWCELATLFYIK